MIGDTLKLYANHYEGSDGLRNWNEERIHDTKQLPLGYLPHSIYCFKSDWRSLTLFTSLAPYERRVIELLRNSKDKRARKLAKKRVCQRKVLARNGH